MSIQEILLDLSVQELNGASLLSKAKKIQTLLKDPDNIPESILVKKKIAILGTTSTQHFKLSLQLFLLKLGVHATFYEAEFNTVVPEILDDHSAFYEFSPDTVIILTHYRDIQSYPDLFSTSDQIENWGDSRYHYYAKLWEKIAQKISCNIFQSTFVLPIERQFSDYESSVPFSKRECLALLNRKLAYLSPPQVTFVDLEYVASYVGKRHWFDEKNYYISKQGFSFDSLGLASHAFTRLISMSYGLVKKCLVLDLDNTLWGGVIGDDGVDGINLDPNDPIGEAFIQFQHYVKGLKERGVILAVCSKNDYENAIIPFESHPHSVLKRDDISCFVANWDDKHMNMKRIAQELNVGLDSLVFFDDNPFERELVSKGCPQVEVVSVSEDPIHYIRDLEIPGCFSWTQLTKEDLNRTQSYHSNLAREELLSDSLDYNDYLKSLNMKATIATVNSGSLLRFVQLINKSNQFNFRTQRYTESEIQSMLQLENDSSLLTVSLSDKFSDYGIISCVILKKKESALFIDTWVMSCRVLKRSIENMVFDAILKIAKQMELALVVGEYIPTEKNKLVKDVYGKVLNGTLDKSWQLTEKNSIAYSWHSKLSNQEFPMIVQEEF